MDNLEKPSSLFQMDPLHKSVQEGNESGNEGIVEYKINTG